MARVELPVRERGVCCPPTRSMRPERVADLSRVLKALADPTRLEIVACLRAAKEPVCVCDFTESFELSQSTLSHHMAVLRAAGLVDVTKGGVWSFYVLARTMPAHVRAVVEAIG